MKLFVRHETLYRYATPVTYSMQSVHLTPRPEPHQQLLEWKVQAPGRLREIIDAFGNISHALTMTKPVQEVSIVAVGEVQVSDTQGLIDDVKPLPVMSYAVPTPLTVADSFVKAFTGGTGLQSVAHPDQALALAQKICEAVRYQSGITQVTSTAGNALQLGVGVCQDHAHLFLACARYLGVAARYVSGYFLPASSTELASHAWVDVWGLRSDGQYGWTSIDVTHACLTDERHCRLAVARDYEGASPVRGVRSGGGREKMVVNVQISDQSHAHAALQFAAAQVVTERLAGG